MVKSPPVNAGDVRCLFSPWVPAPVFLSGESHGQKSLAGYSPWGCEESDTTDAT